MKFSDRSGYKPRKDLQEESMDKELMISLWNCIHPIVESCIDYITFTSYEVPKYKNSIPYNLWTKFFKQMADEFPSAEDFIPSLRSSYERLTWNEVYDLIEFIINEEPHNTDRFISELNRVLDDNNSAWRISDRIIQPLTDKRLLETVKKAKDGDNNSRVQHHLNKAEDLFSRKKNAHYDNACLESIKALEAFLDTQDLKKRSQQLSDRIKSLKGRYNSLILEALNKINAFRGDAAHASSMKDYQVSKEDAILIHVICCAYINYFNMKK